MIILIVEVISICLAVVGWSLEKWQGRKGRKEWQDVSSVEMGARDAKNEPVVGVHERV